MDKLYTLLITKFTEELTRLEIGYWFDDSNLSFMNDLVNSIDYLGNSSLTQVQILQITKYYNK